MAMFDREFRIGACSAMVLLAWGTAVGLLATSGLTGIETLAAWGISCSGLGAALMVIRDNAKTRRVVRAVARELPTAAVRPLRE